MKAQLENSQEGVTTGAQGVTNNQKGLERVKRAKRAKRPLSTILEVTSLFRRDFTSAEIWIIFQNYFLPLFPLLLHDLMLLYYHYTFFR